MVILPNKWVIMRALYIQITQFVSQNKQKSLSMISASLDISDQISVLRAKTVKKIIKLEPQICQISRRELFMAVTLLDNFLLAKKKNGSSNIENSSLFCFSLCICCIRLSCKYQNQIPPKISELAELLQFDGDIKTLSLLYLKTEAEVLTSIDFIMPQETFYTSFESKVEVASLSRQQRAYFLKLFLFGIEFSTELTQKSEYGGRIFEYLKYKKRQDFQIAEYIEQVKKWGKQKN